MQQPLHVTLFEDRHSLKLSLSQCRRKMLSDLQVYIASTWCPGTCPWVSKLVKILMTISDLRWMLHIARSARLTNKFHNKGALLNGLCSLDPPALVGGQEGFHQRRLQLIKWSAQQSQLVSVLAAACKARYADWLDISIPAINLSTNIFQFTVSRPPLCDTLPSCRSHRLTATVRPVRFGRCQCRVMPKCMGQWQHLYGCGHDQNIEVVCCAEQPPEILLLCHRLLEYVERVVIATR